MTLPAPGPRVADSVARKRVRLACALLVLYGLLVVANAVALQSLGGWEDWREFPRALVRLAGMLLVAWGLWRGERWAWWLAVGLGLVWLVTGIGVLIMAWLMAGDVELPMPGFAKAVLILAAGLLAVAVGLLLTPPVRAAFRRPLRN